MEIKTTPNSGSACSGTPGGVFIGIRKTGTQGTRSDRKRRARLRRIAAKTRQMPRFRGITLAARAAPPAARRLVVPLSANAPGFDRVSSLGQ